MQAPLQARDNSDAVQTKTATTATQQRRLVDNRPTALAQRKLAEMMNNSPRVLQQRALSDAIHNSPRMIAQRHAMNTLFGGAVRPQGDGAIPAELSPALGEEKTNNTGLPNQLKSAIESLSGMSMDHVKVYYNSDKPAQLQAHAYAQGSEIHLGAGQERHLPHEVWHVVQQAQGRVRPTLQMGGVAINHDRRLEHEADVMGMRAISGIKQLKAADAVRPSSAGGSVLQAYNISYGGLQNGAGTDMHVYINGKNDPDLHKGSAPSVVPPWWPAAGTHARNYLAQYAVQGHLLNEHLGGPGNNMANLTPITKSTNTTHFHKIEDIVKQAIAADYGVEYRVRATYGQGPSLADFGPAPPAGLAGVLSYFADTIGADYDIYDRHTLKKLKGAPGELLIKNEGRHRKGTF